jgi:hypothetical protein
LIPESGCQRSAEEAAALGAKEAAIVKRKRKQRGDGRWRCEGKKMGASRF